MPKNRCCNEPSGCDTELATEQQSCQLPDGDKEEVRGEGRGCYGTGLASKAVRLIIWTENSLETQWHSKKLLSVIALNLQIAASFMTAQQSVYIPKLETALTDRDDSSLLQFIRRRSRVFNSGGAKIFS